MAAYPKKVNPDLVRQEIEKGRMGDRELAKKPGETPGVENDGEGVVWDEDQRQLDRESGHERNRKGARGRRAGVKSRPTMSEVLASSRRRPGSARRSDSYRRITPVDHQVMAADHV